MKKIRCETSRLSQTIIVTIVLYKKCKNYNNIKKTNNDNQMMITVMLIILIIIMYINRNNDKTIPAKILAVVNEISRRPSRHC